MGSVASTIYGVLALAALICGIVLQIRRKRLEETFLMVVLSQLLMTLSRYLGIRAVLDKLLLAERFYPLIGMAAAVMAAMCVAVFVEKLPRKLRLVLCILAIIVITALWLGLGWYLRQLLIQSIT